MQFRLFDRFSRELKQQVPGICLQIAPVPTWSKLKSLTHGVQLVITNVQFHFAETLHAPVFAHSRHAACNRGQ